MSLNEEHINYIIRDIHLRGIVIDGLDHEIIDHISTAVEIEMASGKNFIMAYRMVLKGFGSTPGLRNTQLYTLHEQNKKTTSMIRNHFIIAWRALSRQRFYALINIGGLAVGVAACLIIMVYVQNELSYDQYNTKASRIFRVDNEIKFAGNHSHLAVSAAPLADAMIHEYAEIESAVRFRNYGSYLVRPSERMENIKEERVIWTDSTFFKVFSVPVLQGKPDRALAEPNCIAISKSMAEKYFTDGDALGKTMVFDNNYTFTVRAVFEDMPEASHFHFDFLIALVGDKPPAKEALDVNFLSNNFNTYLLLKKGADPIALQAKFPDFLRKYVGPQAARALGNDFNIDKFWKEGNLYEYTLMPVSSIHLHSDLQNEFEPNGSSTYIYVLGLTGLFILGIACINFMNLSTARSANRAREVGVRKVLGSLRSHLMRQFLTESVLVTVFSFLLAVLLAAISLPVFNDLASRHLHLPWSHGFFYVILIVGAIVVGVVSGVYPSFFLSAFKPVGVLKGKLLPGMKSGMIRGGLVVFQFIISIFLIIGALTVTRQMQYIRNKKIGFDRDHVIIVHDAYALRPNKINTFKTEVLKSSTIESGSVSGFLPIEGAGAWRNNNSYWQEGKPSTAENLVSMQQWAVDEDYIRTMGMRIKEGRAFSKNFPSDSSAVILNESAVKHFGLGENPIGKRIGRLRITNGGGAPDPSSIGYWTVIGVVNDFHFASMKTNIEPLGLFLEATDGSVSFRFRSENPKEVIATIEKKWKSIAAGQPFQYSFLDEDFGRMYDNEQRLGQLFTIFAGLAIIIACLGLFALSSFTAEQRTREIGIRKVLGASIGSIVVLLSGEITRLVAIAFIIATPLAWYCATRWLETYSYKMPLGPALFLVAGAFAFVIASVTMGYQSIRAARTNPVQSLRSE